MHSQLELEMTLNAYEVIIRLHRYACAAIYSRVSLEMTLKLNNEFDILENTFGPFHARMMKRH